MHRLAVVAAGMLLLATAGCGGGRPANPLIGSWKLDTSVATDPNCDKAYIFSAKSLTRPNPGGQASTIAVNYVGGDAKTFPAVVYVLTDAGIAFHTTYRFADRDHMILDTVMQCPYVRG